MKLLGNTKSKTTKDKNDEIVPYLEIAEVLLVHCTVFNNDCQYDSGVLCTFGHLVNDYGFFVSCEKYG